MSARRLTSLAIAIGTPSVDAGDRTSLLSSAVAELEAWRPANREALRRGLAIILARARDLKTQTTNDHGHDRPGRC